MPNISFFIWDLIAQEDEFLVPSAHGGSWLFRKASALKYQEVVDAIEEGRIGKTFTANNWDVNKHQEFQAIDELLDICLVLSFLTAKCVTPANTAQGCDLTFLGHPPDKFIRPRAIIGYHPLQPNLDLAALFEDGMTKISHRMLERRMQLSLCHWISGLTSFSLEDIFVWAAIQMDIVKQCERRKYPGMDYYSASEKVSKRLKIQKLPIDFKHMRTDLIHEGKLSGKNFSKKTKDECVAVIAKTMSWIDSYVIAVLGMTNILTAHQRWDEKELSEGMPSITLPHSYA